MKTILFFAGAAVGLLISGAIILPPLWQMTFVSKLVHSESSKRIVTELDFGKYELYTLYGGCAPASACMNFYIRNGLYTHEIQKIKDIQDIAPAIDTEEKMRQYITLLDIVGLTHCTNASGIAGKITATENGFVLERARSCYGDPDRVVMVHETIGERGEYMFSEERVIREGNNLFFREY